jgi:hypothetical protein
MSDISPLRQTLDDAIAEHGCSMKDLTVLAPGNDPFRIDTPSGHRDGKWLADRAASLGVGRIHLRGLHYALLGETKPDGSTYVNTDKNWEWLQDFPAKAARWLGYVPFDQITDQRNAAPVVRIFERPDPWPYINVGIDVEIPAADDIIPKLGMHDFVGMQPYKLVMVGEKSSLDVVLGPIAEAYQADLYLPTGDISDTMIYQMARIGDEDSRPMVVLYFADGDPSGWNMGIVIARKLQALEVLHFPGLDVQVRRVALTPDQVLEYGLPSTPLKATEKRANAWTAAYGVEQTEIDALATLRPELLDRLARDAIAPFYDYDLDQRVDEARQAWLDAALVVMNEQIDHERLGRIRAEATVKLDAMREQINALNDELRIDVDDFDLPDIEVPEADPSLGVAPDEPLLDSGWSFVEQTSRLIDSKAYRDGGG